ncbi:hypothetical protein POF45_00870 [Pseudomonas sp. 681]|uniref:Uncharacterized protein n=1 Tax=Pseudomonas fungipugnans TaxID=3024217 RepID=A0ABT6QGJ1_9PSED|nr:hypothetical protein [Pseudomonas sp. 681]MDI2589984.1 hypothetical protein [Pseudomonas sp. 681]
MDGFFRYQSKKYNDSLLRSGNLRIGTLYDFRKSEHKRGVADSYEGKKFVSHKIDSFSSEDNDPVGRKALTDFGMGDFSNCDGLGFRIQGSGSLTLRQNVESQDCFILSLSAVCSSKVFAQLEGSETCVEIIKPQGFIARLTKAITTKVLVKYHGIHAVEYTDADEVWNQQDWGGAPVTKKRTKFSGQYELRAIWTPVNTVEIEPLIIDDKKLTKCVRECLIR